MKLVHIVGARPQFIKMAAVSRAIARYSRECGADSIIDELIVHTGQHYDQNMSAVFFEELQIPKPDYNLGIGSASQGAQTGRMLEALETVLIAEQPDWVLLYGDTNSTVAGALAATKLHIKVAHVEAGLRSFNRRMPEEINRVLTDHASDLLFAPTETAVANLRTEGFTNIVNDGRLTSFPYSLPLDPLLLNPPLVANVGDVMYDSVLYNLKLAEKRSDILKRLHLFPNKPSQPHELNEPHELNRPHEPQKPSEPMRYALATVHRAINTDDPEHLRFIFQALDEIANTVMPIILPLHPRTRNALSALSRNPLSSTPDSLILIDPVSYLDMLVLEESAKLILTDSGGVQKEAFILRTPCVTLREETEWVETVDVSWNVLAGTDRARILQAVDRFSLQQPPELRINPYGDGRASERIVKALLEGSG